MRRGSLKYRDGVDPPDFEAMPGGNGDDWAPVESADTGGGVGFPLRHATALIASTDGSKTQGKKEA